jgi:hypothetical protein
VFFVCFFCGGEERQGGENVVIFKFAKKKEKK